MAIYDLYNWTPAISVGGSRPDNYNIPGATAIDGTISAGEAPAILAGTPVTASRSPLVVPTTAEVNASSDINQIIAATNQRNLLLYQAGLAQSPDTSLVRVQSNISQNAALTATSASTPQTEINVIRLAEGNIYSYPFSTASRTAGQVILGKEFSQMRQALAIGGTDVLELTCQPLTGTSAYPTRTGTRIGHVFNGFNNYFSDDVGGAGAVRVIQGSWADLVYKVGSLAAGGGRWRFRMNFAIPAWLTSCASVNLQIPYGSVTNTNGYTGEIWQGASAGTLTTLLATYTPVASATDVIPLSTTTITAAAGSTIYLTLTTDLERSGLFTANNNFFYVKQADLVPLCLSIAF